MHGCTIGVLAAFMALPVFCQRLETRPAFELASIKLCIGGEPRGSLSASPGRLSVPCFGLYRLIQDAYQVYADGTNVFMIQPPSATPIDGFPHQMSSDRYSIDAKTDSPRSVGMMRGLMMQRLLEERFHLRIHRETREVPVYIMTVAKGGPKLKVTTPGSCDETEVTDIARLLAEVAVSKRRCGILTPPTINGTHFVLDEHGITVAAFSKVFNIGGLPVIDNTGITGAFDIHLEWESSTEESTPDTGAPKESPDTAIISSIRKQLGLQLRAGKGPREFFIIDHLERPSAN